MAERTFLVTGGGTGIGRAISLALGGEGTRGILMGRRLGPLQDTANQLRDRGGVAEVVQADITDSASLDLALSRMGGPANALDILVNNAGEVDGGPIDQFSEVRWKAIIDSNLTGTYLLTRRVVPLLREGGRIVNIGSVLGRFGVPEYTAYCAAKHGVIGFTRALALELASRAITVNAICPGWVETDMATDRMRQGAISSGISFEDFCASAIGAVPINRFIAPDEVAHLVQFLCDPLSGAITGQTYNICGGQRMD